MGAKLFFQEAVSLPISSWNLSCLGKRVHLCLTDFQGLGLAWLPCHCSPGAVSLSHGFNSEAPW